MMVMGENLFAFFGIAKFGQNLIRDAPHLPLQRNMQCGSCIALSKDLGHRTTRKIYLEMKNKKEDRKEEKEEGENI